MAKFKTFVLFLLLNVPVDQVKTSSLEEPDCRVGTYFSRYFNPDGSCADCPEHWSLCQNEHAKDVRRCEKACGKPTLSPSTTPSTAQFFKSTSSPIVQKSNPTFEDFLTPSTPDSDIKKKPTEEDDDNKMWMYIVIGVCSLIFVALVVVGILVIVRYKKIKTKSNTDNVQEEGPAVTAQSPNSTSLTSEKYSFQETGSTSKYSSSVSLSMAEF